MKKSTKIAHLNHRMRTVSMFGTALFVAFVIVNAFMVGSTALVLGELKMSHIIAGNIVVALAAFAIPLVAYFIGDSSTNSRSKYEHYYNGVLFAFMSFGLSLLVSLFMYAFIPGAVELLNLNQFAQFIPSLIALAIALLIGRLYHKQRHQKQLDAHLPFQVAYITPMLLLAVAGAFSLFSDAFGSTRGAWHDVAAIQLLLMMVMIFVPLFLSHRTTLLGKLTDTFIAFGIGNLAVIVFSQISMKGFGDLIDPLIPFIMGTLVWLAFVYYYYYRKN
jgi:hypothetical protein